MENFSSMLYYVSERGTLFTYEVRSRKFASYRLPKLPVKYFEYLIARPGLRLFICGGIIVDAIIPIEPSRNLLSFDLLSPQKGLSQLAPMSCGQVGHCMLQPSANWIYVLGGSNFGGVCEKYSTLLNLWRPLPRIEIKIENPLGFVLGGRLCVMDNVWLEYCVFAFLDITDEEAGWTCTRVGDVCAVLCGLQISDNDLLLLCNINLTKTTQGVGGWLFYEDAHQSCLYRSAMIYSVRTGGLSEITQMEIATMGLAAEFLIKFTRQPAVGVGGRLYTIDQATYDLHVYNCVRHQWETVKGRDWNPL